MPSSALVTDPEPEPQVPTVRIAGPMAVNAAVTVCDAFMFTTQNAVPSQPAPDQPVKDDPAAAVAYRITVEPCA
jgi:hypothetical protein